MDLQDLETTPVSVRMFLHNFKDFQQGSAAVMITKHGKEQGVFIPYRAWKHAKRKPVYLSKEELQKYISKPDGGPSDLSMRIDEIYDM